MSFFFFSQIRQFSHSHLTLLSANTSCLMGEHWSTLASAAASSLASYECLQSPRHREKHLGTHSRWDPFPELSFWDGSLWWRAFFRQYSAIFHGVDSVSFGGWNRISGGEILVCEEWTVRRRFCPGRRIVVWWPQVSETGYGGFDASDGRIFPKPR